MVIPLFAKSVESLSKIREEAYKRSRRRTKRSIQNIKLAHLSLGAQEIAAYLDLQKVLWLTVTLSHTKKQYVI